MYENVEIVLGGLDQKTDARLTAAGKLAEAINCEVDKVGTFKKRRGFFLVDCNDEVFGNGNVERLCHRLGVYEGELLIFGYDFVHSVVSRDASVPTSKSTVLRGVVPRGVITRVDVTGGGGGVENVI